MLETFLQPLVFLFQQWIHFLLYFSQSIQMFLSSLLAFFTFVFDVFKVFSSLQREVLSSLPLSWSRRSTSPSRDAFYHSCGYKLCSDRTAIRMDLWRIYIFRGDTTPDTSGRDIAPFKFNHSWSRLDQLTCLWWISARCRWSCRRRWFGWLGGDNQAELDFEKTLSLTHTHLWTCIWRSDLQTVHRLSVIYVFK